MAYARWLVLFVAAIAAGGYCAPRLLRPPPGVPTWLFFDGVCNLCDGFVNFVADGDSRKNIKFGAIQRHTELLETHGALTDLSTVVVVQGSKVYTRSSAVMRVLAVMDQPWRSFTLFYFIPSFLRDLGYRCAPPCNISRWQLRSICVSVGSWPTIGTGSSVRQNSAERRRPSLSHGLSSTKHPSQRCHFWCERCAHCARYSPCSRESHMLSSCTSCYMNSSTITQQRDSRPILSLPRCC
jgi:predicted DCC family thiol-disulfide oxidoreductase YuxK